MVVHPENVKIIRNKCRYVTNVMDSICSESRWTRIFRGSESNCFVYSGRKCQNLVGILFVSMLVQTMINVKVNMKLLKSEWTVSMPGSLWLDGNRIAGVERASSQLDQNPSEEGLSKAVYLSGAGLWVYRTSVPVAIPWHYKKGNIGNKTRHNSRS